MPRSRLPNTLEEGGGHHGSSTPIKKHPPTAYPAAPCIPMLRGLTLAHVFMSWPYRRTFSAEPVRTYQSFTDDLHQMADWLVDLGITTVAMESTGIYWIPAFEILEARGLEVLLVNARHVKNVPGRKTDVHDACLAPATASARAAPGQFPAGQWPRRPPGVSAAPRALVGVCGRPHPAYAKSPDADECPIAPRRDGYYWGHRDEDRSRDRGRQSRSGDVGGLPGCPL